MWLLSHLLLLKGNVTEGWEDFLFKHDWVRDEKKKKPALTPPAPRLPPPLLRYAFRQWNALFILRAEPGLTDLMQQPYPNIGNG